VQDAGIAARGEVGHVAPNVADDPYSEVRTAAARRARVEGHVDILAYLDSVVNTT